MSDYAKKLENSIDAIAGKKTVIDTRLQGSKNKQTLGSYWARFGNDITGALAISPLIKQEEVATAVEETVKKGIAFNVEQRAFLSVIKDKIATTFNVFDSNLLKLVRIQQADSTAARLGMESAMTAFLNNMYETTEYLEGVAESVRGNLYEAEALLSENAGLELEYQMQKWLGSLYSVGMSDQAVNAIATAFGQIASGQIEGVTGGQTSNLLLMAANKAGLPVADILQKGITASDTNNLLNAVVSYMASLYTENAGNRVVQQQLASVFGVKASDLKAAANLVPSLSTINSNSLTVDSAYQQLTNMANSMYSRVSTGDMLQNLTSNFQYTLAGGIANNPALYMVYKMANLLEDLTGGINIPSFMTFGTGLDLNATIADLMRVGALSGGILSGIASAIGAGSGGGILPSGILSAFGITGGSTKVARGTGAGLITSGATVSESGYITNASSDDITNKTLSEAETKNEKVLAENKKMKMQISQEKIY